MSPVRLWLAIVLTMTFVGGPIGGFVAAHYKYGLIRKVAGPAYASPSRDIKLRKTARLDKTQDKYPVIVVLSSR